MRAALAEPRLRYLGVIDERDERLDPDLPAAVADARPDWSVVLVGPVRKIAPAALPRRPNLHYLGQKAYCDLPTYVKGFDVCLMPFALNEAPRFISPTRTLEYPAPPEPIHRHADGCAHGPGRVGTAVPPRRPAERPRRGSTV